MTKDKLQSSDLINLQIFKGFSPKQLGLLARNMTALYVKRGEVIHRPGQTANNLYLVLEGEVGLSLLGSKGRALRLMVLAQGEFFGVNALIPGWRHVSHASVLRNSRIGEIQARNFVEKVCGLNWKNFATLTEITLKPLLLVSLRRAMYLLEDLPNRLATTLWEYAGHPEATEKGGLLPLSLTHEELSGLVGASRPRVSLALKQLEDRGFFIRKGKQMLVQSDALSNYLRREYEFLL
jgi:CRP/FNR family transcriptional regulator, cyclic AMP receptor protein